MNAGTHMQSLGIDVGGTSVKLAVIQDGSPLWTAKSREYVRPDRDELIDAIRCAVRDRDISAVQNVGLCVPGLLDAKRRVITLSVNVPGLMGIVLDELVQLATGQSFAQIRICNDAVSAGTDIVLAKQLTGRVACIALGTGVGMAILDDGVPLIVEGSSPGHIGQVDVSIGDASEEVPIGPDGGAGSLEGYMGVPALIRRYGSTQTFLQTASIDHPPIRALARAIRIVHAIYRPQHIVLAGGIGIRLAPMIDQLRALIATRLTSVAREGWTLLTGDHDFHAALGAARLASTS